MANRGPVDITVYVRPEDNGWIMGPDLPVELPNSHTVNDLKNKIRQLKGIPRRRMVLHDPSGEPIHPSKMGWMLRRVGINDGTVVLLRPTISGCIQWETVERYTELYLESILACLEKHGSMTLEELHQQVDKPRPVRVNLRCFLRMHSERVFMHVNSSTGETRVSVNTRLFLPMFDDEAILCMSNGPSYSADRRLSVLSSLDTVAKRRLYDPAAAAAAGSLSEDTLQTEDKAEHGNEEAEEADNASSGESESDAEAESDPDSELQSVGADKSERAGS